jgi:hypothetical protein
MLGDLNAASSQQPAARQLGFERLASKWYKLEFMNALESQLHGSTCRISGTLIENGELATEHQTERLRERETYGLSF